MGYILLRYHANPLPYDMRLPSDAFALGEGPTRGGLSHIGFHPLRRIVPLQGTPSCAFGAALLQGPTREGLSHMGFYTAAANCASSRHSILRLWRGPSPRACTRGLSHMGFHAAATNCASSRHSILRFWRGPSPRAYSRGIISHGLLYRCSELCLFEALYPAPLARPFSKPSRLAAPL